MKKIFKAVFFCVSVALCLPQQVLAKQVDASKPNILFYLSKVGIEDYDTIQFCVSKGFGVHESDEFGRTPLHYASKHGYSIICKALIDLGADPHIRDNFGKTAITLAKSKGIEQILKK